MPFALSVHDDRSDERSEVRGVFLRASMNDDGRLAEFDLVGQQEATVFRKRADAMLLASEFNAQHGSRDDLWAMVVWI